jgi:5-formyltetrahydrofolate cyclo-ligase
MEMAKKQLREQMRMSLAQWSIECRLAASHSLAERILQLDIWRQALVIGLFAGRKDEMETSLLWAEERIFAYPKVEGAGLHFYQVGHLQDLQPGPWSLMEPTGGNVIVPDLVLVPGLAFDVQGGRLGRGKGFYDRWFADHPQVATLGVAFDLQIIGQLATELHDRRMDCVVTETCVYYPHI